MKINSRRYALFVLLVTVAMLLSACAARVLHRDNGSSSRLQTAADQQQINIALRVSDSRQKQI